jgi:hypothetical protein
MKRGLVFFVLMAIAGVVSGTLWTRAELGSSGDLSQREKLQIGIIGKTAPVSGDVKRDAPEIEVIGGTSFNFGTGEVFVKQRHNFVVKNVGKTKLGIKYLDSSCKCTSSNMKKDVWIYVEPGAEEGIELEWEAKETAEYFSQNARIETTDPKLPMLTLTVAGKVTSNVIVDQTEVVFTVVPINQPVSQVINVFYLITKDAPKPTWKCNDPALEKFIDIEWTKADEEAMKAKSAVAGWKGKLTVKPGLPLGDFSAILQLDLGSQFNMKPEVTVKGFVVGNFSLLGAKNWDPDHNILNIGEVPQKKGSPSNELSLEITGDAIADLKPTVKKVLPSYITVTFGEPKYNKETNRTTLPLNISIPPDSPPENHMGGNAGKAGQVFIDLGLPDHPDLRISVKFSVN